MNIEELREYCLRKAGAEESFPFGESVLVFKVGGKIFLLADLTEGNSFNAKCDPDHAVELRERHEEVRPGYHMNKRHWNTVRMDGGLKTKELREMIDHSYEIVVGGLSKKLRAGIGWLSVWVFIGLLPGSCRRSGPPSSPPTQGKPLTINLTCPLEAVTHQHEFELILSETSGKKLLDILSPVNTNISATVYTDDTLIDVTSIQYDSVFKRYDCRMYKAVNPSHWVTSINESPPLSLPGSGGQAANIYYKNAPSASQSDWYFNSGGYSPPNSTLLNGNTFSVAYNQFPNAYTYLYIPESYLYKFHRPATISDTVDLSQMDTAAGVTIPCPTGDQIILYYLVGVIDTTDISTAVLLHTFQSLGSGSASFGYPPKYVQKYETEAFGQSNDNTEQYVYYNYSDSVPETLAFQDHPDYTLNASGINNFNVSFTGPKPSYYATVWSTGNLEFAVFESPDSSLRALPLLKSLQSKMLAGQDLSSLSLIDFNYEMAKGYDYAGFLNYACNPSLVATYRMDYESEYFKMFY
jgi:predicted DNA-binding protein (MmcQ/YjbR family)